MTTEIDATQKVRDAYLKTVKDEGARDRLAEEDYAIAGDLDSLGQVELAMELEERLSEQGYDLRGHDLKFQVGDDTTFADLVSQFESFLGELSHSQPAAK